MPDPQIDTGYPPGTYPPTARGGGRAGTFGYPNGAAVLDPLQPKNYPVASGAVPCSNPQGYPAGVTVTKTGSVKTWQFNSDFPASQTVTWNYGDGTANGTAAGGTQVSHTYSTVGTFTVTATSSDGQSGTVSVTTT